MEPVSLSDHERSGYRQLTLAAVYRDLDLTVVRITGADRSAFLHNLCSNEMAKLSAGQVREAFFLSVQGKLVGHVLIAATAAAHWAVSAPSQADRLTAHLDRYIIREDVTLEDQSDSRRALLVAGPLAVDALNAAGLHCDSAPAQNRVCSARFAAEEMVDHELIVIGTPWLSTTALLVLGSERSVGALGAKLAANGIDECSQAVFEAARVEHGWPWYGVDISADNLPQEVARDEQAISLVKGCYLGQETVARIDALGHVNWLLRGISAANATDLPSNSELVCDGKIIARVKSVVYSPKLERPLALAMTRHEYAADGTSFTTAGGGLFQVHSLPIT